MKRLGETVVNIAKATGNFAAKHYGKVLLTVFGLGAIGGTAAANERSKLSIKERVEFLDKAATERGISFSKENRSKLLTVFVDDKKIEAYKEENPDVIIAEKKEDEDEIVEEEATNPDTATTQKTPKKGFFVVKDPKTGKTLATENGVEGGDDDTTQIAVKNFLSLYLKVKTSQSENFKGMISRLSKINTKYSTIVKLKNAKMLKSIGGNLKNTYGLVDDKEKAKIEKIAAFYNDTYGMNISDLAKKVVKQEKKVIASTETEEPFNPFASNADDDVVKSEAGVAEAKANVEKSLTQGRDKLIKAARNYVAIGGNPAELPGWEKASEKYKITPDDL